MNRKQEQERRLYPRVDMSWPMRVSANGYDFVTSTKNLSCVGAYCHIDKYVPPFTKIYIKLQLPIAENQTVSHKDVECKGVIVRTLDDEAAGGFNVAIFFNDIKEDQRQKISRYITQFLPK